MENEPTALFGISITVFTRFNHPYKLILQFLMRIANGFDNIMRFVADFSGK